MLVYLTTVYHMPSVNAATHLNVFFGRRNFTTVFGAYVCNNYIRRCTTIAVATMSSFTACLSTPSPPRSISSILSVQHIQRALV